jgi:hypothetical protein
MKATDFNLSKEIKFSLETGITTFRDSRLVLFDANAIGLLRQNLIDELGMGKARSFFLKFGFQNGYADFMQMKISYEFDSEIDLLASDPVIHTYEGIVQATPKELRFNRETGEFFFTGVWSNSYEAEQHLSYNHKSTEPVCWSLMGYASGWCTAFFGKLIIGIEPICVGMGDPHCEWLLKPLAEWGEEVKPYYEAYKVFGKE